MKIKVQSDSKEHKIDHKVFGVPKSTTDKLKASTAKLHKSGKDLKKTVRSYMAKKMKGGENDAHYNKWKADHSGASALKKASDSLASRQKAEWNKKK